MHHRSTSSMSSMDTDVGGAFSLATIRESPLPSSSPSASPSPSPCHAAHQQQQSRAPLHFSSPLSPEVWQPEFDCSAYTGDALLELAVAIVEDAECMQSEDDASREERFAISRESLRAFLADVQRHHHIESVYHGWTHGVHVLLNTFRLLQPVLKHYRHVERLTMLLSAVTHDIQHCGMGNRWCVDNKYVLNQDHKEKGYTKNLLERNSVDRTIELLTGAHFSVAFGHTPAAASHAAAAAASSFAAPRNYLQEWGFSPSLRDDLLSHLSEYILNTDIGDPDRHVRLTAAFVATLNDQAETAAAMEEPAAAAPAAAAASAEECKQTTMDIDPPLSPSPPAVAYRPSRTSFSGGPQPSIGKKRRSGVPQDLNGSVLERKKSRADSDLTPSGPNANFSFASSTHRLALARIVLLCADVGCVAEVFPLVISWADRLYEESVLGQNFVTQADVFRPGQRLDYGLTQSRYVIEHEANRASTEAAASHAAAAASASLSAPPPAPITVPCADLTRFWSSQVSFFMSYALPLYLPLYTSGLVPRISEHCFPQLRRNLQYIRLSDAYKAAGVKMHVRLRHPLPSDLENRQVIQMLRDEYAAVADFHRSLNEQQAETHPAIQPLLLLTTPSIGTEASVPQAHAEHRHRTEVVCHSVAVP